MKVADMSAEQKVKYMTTEPSGKPDGDTDDHQYVGDIILQYGRHDVCGKDQYPVDGSGRDCIFGDGDHSGVRPGRACSFCRCA